jgi:Domain of unknown function (DUF4349)
MLARTRLLSWRGLAILVIVGSALIVGACGGATNESGGSSRGDQAAGAPAGADTIVEPQSEPGAGDETLPNPAMQDRKIVRNATLELRVENIAAAVQEVEDVAGAAGGFVSSSNVFVSNADEQGESVERTQTASVTVRVPADSYASVMGQLRGIATETVSETSDASEVTEEYTDLQARLRNLEATEARYLELLARAGTIDEILTVQDRLNTVRLEIEQVTGRINVLNSLTDFATITVRLALPPAVAEGGGDNQNWAEDAWQWSWEASQDGMVVLGTVAIVGGVIAAWMVLPMLALFIVWRVFGRRLMELARKLSQA